nr:MAG TPA: hypothetical protein [Caudoviricetes sp.]
MSTKNTLQGIQMNTIIVPKTAPQHMTALSSLTT